MREIILKCRHCGHEINVSPIPAGGLPCPSCGKLIPLRPGPALETSGIVEHCVACGHDALYIQKDFNRNLGVGIVAVGSLASLYFFSRSQPLLGMLALFISAGVDYVIYRLVGEVTVCYACHTIYRDFARNPEHGPFDLKELEKHGGRDPRF